MFHRDEPVYSWCVLADFSVRSVHCASSELVSLHPYCVLVRGVPDVLQVSRLIV